MSSRLTVIFYIILCLEIGLVLTFLPWVSHGFLGLSDWGNNYFLLAASHRVGFGVQRVVASGWMRGAVSGIGLLNIGMAFWELFNFRRTVRALWTTSCPSTRAAPEVGISSVTSILIVVVFPAPFGPSKPKSSPSFTSKSIPRTASMVFVRRRTKPDVCL